MRNASLSRPYRKHAQQDITIVNFGRIVHQLKGKSHYIVITCLPRLTASVDDVPVVPLSLTGTL